MQAVLGWSVWRIFKRLFDFGCRNRSDAILNAVVMVLASVLFFEGLGALVYRVANIDFWNIICAHFGSFLWLIHSQLSLF
jgi:hypothetical protein